MESKENLRIPFLRYLWQLSTLNAVPRNFEIIANPWKIQESLTNLALYSKWFIYSTRLTNQSIL